MMAAYRAFCLQTLGVALLPSALAQTNPCFLFDSAVSPTRREGWGQAAAVSGDRILVGVPGELSIPSWGAAYLFRVMGNRAVVQEVLIPAGATQGIGFASSLAMQGDLAVVGAMYELNPDAIGGSAYVFERDGSGRWNFVCRFVADQPDPDPVRNDYFGCSVAIENNLIVVGAYGDGPDGSAYIFARDAIGEWLQIARLTPADPLAWYFGYSVAILGDTILVGSPNDFQQGNYAGSAYVFNRDAAGVWCQTAKLLPQVGHLQVSGAAVALGDSSALVCAPGAIGGRGGVYVFNRELDGDWISGQFLRPRNPNDFSAFGSSVAVYGNRALIGASANNGVAFVFERNLDGDWREIAQLTAPGGGYSVAAGEHLGVVGAPFYDAHGEDAGAAYVFAVGPDSDDNGVMDVCECRAAGDLTLDGVIEFQDLILVLSSFAVDEGGDLDADGDTDLQDLATLLAHFGDVCP